MSKNNTTKEEKDLKGEGQGESFVDKTEFDSFKKEMQDSFKFLTQIIEKKVEAPQTPAEKAVVEAGPTMTDFNPLYDKRAKDILGDRIERTYMTFPKGGGSLFTIVIKKEFSNAPKDYLERYHEDRRTVNLEREEFRGEDGADKWAKLILQNLNKTLR